jgi:hypothetical protein
MTQSTASSTAHVHHAQDGLIMAEIGAVCVAVWRKKPTPERFAEQKLHLDQVVRKHPGSAVFLVIVEADSEPPDEPERKASSKMIAGHGSNLKAVACVIEGDGFKAAIIRSVLAGIALFARAPAPIKYFDSVASASQWIASQTSIGPIPAFVRQAEELRKLL